MVNIANNSLYRCDNVCPCRLTGKISSTANAPEAVWIANGSNKNYGGDILSSDIACICMKTC